MQQMYEVSKPPAYPYMCIRCRRSDINADMWVDTGAETEYDGRIYFCADCCTDLVNCFSRSVTLDWHNAQKAWWQEQLDKAEFVIKSYGERVEFLKSVGIDIETPLTAAPTLPVGFSVAKSSPSEILDESEINERVSGNAIDSTPDGDESSVNGDEPSITPTDSEPSFDFGPIDFGAPVPALSELR